MGSSKEVKAIATVNEMRSGVAAALAELFPDIAIVEEKAPDGTAKPFFEVKFPKLAIGKEMDRRYRREFVFEIRYTALTNAEWNDVADRLPDRLELITVGGQPCRGQEMNLEMTDGVLLFRVRYVLTVVRTMEPQFKMESLTQKGETKHA